MRDLRDMPIKRKLVSITMLTSFVALLLACGAFVSYERIVYRQSLVSGLASSASIVGNNSAAALAFEEPNSAARTLASLKTHPNIVAAAIYDADGRLFATYRRPGADQVSIPETLLFTGPRFLRDALEYVQPIDLAGETAGTVYIHSDLTEMRERMERYAAIVLMVLAAASATALLLSTILNRAISDPLSHLTRVVRMVSKEQEPSIRAVRRSDDELGQLIDGFNGMLDRIEERERQLREAHDTLEKRVEERTEQLRHSLAVLNATLQSTADGILAVEYESGMISYNKQYQELWRLPDELLAPGREASDKRIEYTAAQIKDPAAYFERTEEISRHPEAFDVLELKDGRTIERYVKPQIIDGKVVGMVVNYRDITERKRAEQELLEAHKRLVDASRQAGMAEVATGVLHNVGNVLNSVNVSANIVIDIARRSKVSSLARVGALLREHEHDLADFISNDSRGKHLPGYLVQLSDVLLDELGLAVRELESLRKNVDHIKEIVAMQQGYSKLSGVKEEMNVADLIEDTLRMMAPALERHGITVVKEIEPVPPVMVEKHKVLQILVNLVRNAKLACSDSGRPDKYVTIRASTHEHRARIQVIDNGVGIPAENLTRIFNHGFTTRLDGHGFGLHSGALAAREIGGALSAASEGVGLGATFTLDLPLATPDTPHTQVA
jgi:PAS domain S-box-containing protein